MSLRINLNQDALSIRRSLSGIQTHTATAAEQLSSGLRINHAADDAAGVGVSEKLRNQVNGLNRARQNAQDGISLIQTAEGALTAAHSLLSRMRELAVQAANDTLSHSDRDHIQDEVNALVSEMDRISTSAQFNQILLLDNSAIGLGLHVGANAETGNGANQMLFDIGGVTPFGLGDVNGVLGLNWYIADPNGVETPDLPVSSLDSGDSQYSDGSFVYQTLVVNSQKSANIAIQVVDMAMEQVSTVRGNLGSLQNRLEHTITNLSVASDNTAAARARIQDADLAASMGDLLRSQLVQQSGVSVLAQANQDPEAVLQLLR